METPFPADFNNGKKYILEGVQSLIGTRTWHHLFLRTVPRGFRQGHRWCSFYSGIELGLCNVVLANGRHLLIKPDEAG